MQRKNKKVKAAVEKHGKEIIKKNGVCKMNKKNLMREVVKTGEKQEKSAVTPYFTHEFSKSSVMSFLIFQKWAANDIEKKLMLRTRKMANFKIVVRRFSEKCCYKSQVFQLRIQVLSLRPQAEDKGDFFHKRNKMVNLRVLSVL